MLDLENIEEKFERIIETREWKKFIDDWKNAENIYIVGNGGLYPTACHAASDATRLISNKMVHSLDNMSFLTSVANDYGYDNVFREWFDYIMQRSIGQPAMFIGLSCSGNSKNVIEALKHTSYYGFSTALISGQPSKYNDDNFNEVCMNTKYFHTSEILSMLLIYDAIDKCGGRCPTIKEENERKGHS